MNNKILQILRNTVGFFNMFNLKLNFLSCPTHDLVFFIKCRNARGHNFYKATGSNEYEALYVLLWGVSFLSFRLCHLPVIIQYYPQSQYILLSLANDLKQYTGSYISMKATILHVILALCAWASQYHIQNAPSVWSFKKLTWFLDHLHKPSSQQRPHPFPSKQPIPLRFFSAGRSQISWDHLLKTPDVYFLTHTLLANVSSRGHSLLFFYKHLTL